MRLPSCLLLASFLSLTACAPPDGMNLGTGSGSGGGHSSGSHRTGGGVTITGTGNGSGTAGGATTTDCAPVLVGTIRDHSPTTHPDFEYKITDDHAIVQDTLGKDGKPVYGGNPTTPTTH